MIMCQYTEDTHIITCIHGNYQQFIAYNNTIIIYSLKMGLLKRNMYTHIM